MALTLGTKPDSLRVLLNPGADFMLTLRPSQGSDPWPEGVRLELVIGERVWTAVATAVPNTDPVERTATFAIDQDEVDAALAQEDLTAKLWYVDPNVTAAQTGSTDTSGSEIRLLMARGVAINNG